MTESAPDLSPLGQLLESRRSNLRMSGREAARRAGISEASWRRVLKGRPQVSARMVVAVALALDVDPAEALALAGGVTVAPEYLPTLVADVRRSLQTASPVQSERGDRMARQIEQIKGMLIEPAAKERIIADVIDMYAEIDAQDKARIAAEIEAARASGELERPA